MSDGPSMLIQASEALVALAACRVRTMPAAAASPRRSDVVRRLRRAGIGTVAQAGIGGIGQWRALHAFRTCAPARLLGRTIRARPEIPGMVVTPRAGDRPPHAVARPCRPDPRDDLMSRPRRLNGGMMDYRPDAFDRYETLDPATAARIAHAIGSSPSRGAARALRLIALVAGAPLHLAALALWWPARRLLAAGRIDRALLGRMSETLAG